MWIYASIYTISQKISLSGESSQRWYVLGVALIAEMDGPYAPSVGSQELPFPAQKRWISRWLSLTAAVNSLTIEGLPPTSLSMSKSRTTRFP